MVDNANYYIGWDVGGWNCDKNQNSRDAIVILDEDRRICGVPWRGNLRLLINQARTSHDWVEGLFQLCDADRASTGIQVTLAIDTPLGFSQAFQALIDRQEPVSEPLEVSNTNPYLYRQTELLLFQRGLRPLSAVKDMIGSQATKGMHVLGKFAPGIKRCGVWTDHHLFTALEAYPSACNRSATVAALGANYTPLGNADKEDALACALVAFLFDKQPNMLFAPGDDIPVTEGWIWTPKDALDIPAIR